MSFVPAALVLIILFILWWTGILYANWQIIIGLLAIGLLIWILAGRSSNSSSEGTAAALGAIGGFGLSELLDRRESESNPISTDGSGNTRDPNNVTANTTSSSTSAPRTSPNTGRNNSSNTSANSRGSNPSNNPSKNSGAPSLEGSGNNNPSLPSGGDSNLNNNRDNDNMADNVEQEMHNLFSLIREEEQLDGEEMEHLKQAERDAKAFLEDYEQYKGHIKLLKNRVNGNISEAEYLERMQNLQLQGGEAGAPNKYKELHDKLEEMKQLLTDLMEQLQTVEELEKRALQDDQKAESEVRNILQESHLEDLERAIEQMSR